MEYLTLNTGARIPMEGFGVFKIRDKELCRQAVYDAIKVGYRLFDTAAVYTNEDALGDGIRRAIDEGLVTREELFITSKIWVQDLDREAARKAIDASLNKCGLEYFDLYLIHQAARDYFGAWRSLEEAYEDGRLRAIGVSNFYPFLLANFCETVRVIPAVNQVEMHPWFIQDDALAEAERYGVKVEAWAPLGGSRYDLNDNAIIAEIAKKYNKTPAQVALRWNVQRGVIVIPKSAHPERIRENFQIWDFQLTDDEIKRISSLDMGHGGTRTKHFDPEFVRSIINDKIHD